MLEPYYHPLGIIRIFMWFFNISLNFWQISFVGNINLTFGESYKDVTIVACYLVILR